MWCTDVWRRAGGGFGKAEEMARTADQVAGCDRPARNLVAGGNALDRGHAIRHDHARRQARARDQHAIIGMQSDDRRWRHGGVSLKFGVLPLPVLYGESIGRLQRPSLAKNPEA